MPNYLTKLVGELVDAGLELPVPIARFLEKDAVPFALDTRQRLPEWCQAHGYSDKQRQTLNQLIRLIVRRDAYLCAVVRDGHRIDLDGGTRRNDLFPTKTRASDAGSSFLPVLADSGFR